MSSLFSFHFGCFRLDVTYDSNDLNSRQLITPPLCYLTMTINKTNNRQLHSPSLTVLRTHTSTRFQLLQNSSRLLLQTIALFLISYKSCITVYQGKESLRLVTDQEIFNKELFFIIILYMSINHICN